MQKTVFIQFKRLTMNNTGADHLQSYIRARIVSQACAYDIPECTDEAVKQFKEYMDHPDNNP